MSITNRPHVEKVIPLTPREELHEMQRLNQQGNANKQESHLQTDIHKPSSRWTSASRATAKIMAEPDTYQLAAMARAGFNAQARATRRNQHGPVSEEAKKNVEGIEEAAKASAIVESTSRRPADSVLAVKHMVAKAVERGVNLNYIYDSFYQAQTRDTSKVVVGIGVKVGELRGELRSYFSSIRPEKEDEQSDGVLIKFTVDQTKLDGKTVMYALVHRLEMEVEKRKTDSLSDRSIDALLKSELKRLLSKKMFMDSSIGNIEAAKQVAGELAAQQSTKDNVVLSKKIEVAIGEFLERHMPKQQS